MPKSQQEVSPLRWSDLSRDQREALGGKLTGLWGAADDERAFNLLSVDKQQTLLLIMRRMQAHDLWHVLRKIENVYGEGGVGIGFSAWPLIKSTLTRRHNFTRWLANHKDTSGGFYEKGRAEAVLHFLYQEGPPRRWYVHFDLFSPVHSLASAVKHIRHEFLGKAKPDWRVIEQYLRA
jgi:hypothetical protein